jgi:hypothetical protein
VCIAARFGQTGPVPNGTEWDFDGASTAFLVRPQPPHYALVGRGGGGRGVVGWEVSSFNGTMVWSKPREVLAGGGPAREYSYNNGYVEAGAPPVRLSTGDYLATYDTILNDGRVAPARATHLGCVDRVCRAFGAGWLVLNGSAAAPLTVVQRGLEPLLMPALPWELGGGGGGGGEWAWMQPTGPAIGATNGLMPVAEDGDHDAFIAWACSSDSVVTPWVLRVRHWVV